MKCTPHNGTAMWPALLVLVLLVAAAPAAVHAAPRVVVSAAAPGFAAAARSVDKGGELTISNYAMEGAPPATFQLRRFEVWAPGAEVVVHHGGIAQAQAAPDTRFFKGAVEGQPGSSVMLSLHPDGGVAGMAWAGNGTWALGRAGAGAAGGPAAAAVGPGPGPLTSRKARPGEGPKEPFQCHTQAHQHMGKPLPVPATLTTGGARAQAIKVQQAGRPWARTPAPPAGCQHPSSRTDQACLSMAHHCMRRDRGCVTRPRWPAWRSRQTTRFSKTWAATRRS